MTAFCSRRLSLGRHPGSPDHTCSALGCFPAPPWLGRPRGRAHRLSVAARWRSYAVGGRCLCFWTRKAPCGLQFCSPGSRMALAPVLVRSTHSREDAAGRGCAHVALSCPQKPRFSGRGRNPGVAADSGGGARGVAPCGLLRRRPQRVLYSELASQGFGLASFPGPGRSLAEGALCTGRPCSRSIARRPALTRSIRPAVLDAGASPLGHCLVRNETLAREVCCRSVVDVRCSQPVPPSCAFA